jgi:phosphopantothenoylcysteine decarboxylase/phosphopantothenate--cysteine ligase
MGYAIAEAALERGHHVTLISGRVTLSAPPTAHIISVTTAEEMFQAVMEQAATADVLVMCAAVADYRPAQFSPKKIKKHSAPLTLELVPTRDILASLPRHRKFFVVGFAAETNDLEENAKKKLQQKNLDMIVANDVSRSDLGMESAENEVTIFFRDQHSQRIPRGSKKNIARELVKIISNTKKNV